MAQSAALQACESAKVSAPGVVPGRVVEVSAPGAQRMAPLWVSAALMVLVGYLVQLASPLRLYGDGIDYLMQAQQLLDGLGFRPADHGIPPGYPMVLATIARLGWNPPAVFVGFNVLCLGLGLWWAYDVLRRAFQCRATEAFAVVVGTALSWVVVKHAPLTLADVPYFGCSMAALAALARAEARGSLTDWVMASLLAVASLLVRTIGIALIPALGWVWLRHRRRWGPWTSLGALVVTFAPLAGLGYAMVLSTDYVGTSLQLHAQMGGFLDVVRAVWSYRLLELGELAINLPLSRVPAAWRNAYFVLGSVAMTGILLGLWRRRRAVCGADVYVAAYLLLIVSVPAHDARYWLPLLPILPVLTARAVSALHPMRHTAVHVVLCTYGMVFALAGVAALGYSTFITCSSARFPEVYGDGSLRQAYRAAYGHAEPTEPMSDRERMAWQLLRRFDPRAAERG